MGHCVRGYKNPSKYWFIDTIGKNFLSTLEQQYCDLSQVEIDEVPCFVGDVWAKISSHNAMPGRVVLFVKFLFNICSNILLYVVFFQSLRGTVHSILLHFLRHVGILNHSFTVRHGGAGINEQIYMSQWIQLS